MLRLLMLLVVRKLHTLTVSEIAYCLVLHLVWNWLGEKYVVWIQFGHTTSAMLNCHMAYQHQLRRITAIHNFPWLHGTVNCLSNADSRNSRSSGYFLPIKYSDIQHFWSTVFPHTIKYGSRHIWTQSPPLRNLADGWLAGWMDGWCRIKQKQTFMVWVTQGEWEDPDTVNKNTKCQTETKH